MADNPLLTINRLRVKSFLAEPLLARLATCNPRTSQPHVVPVWYEWDGRNLWISSFRATRKVREIQSNPNVSIIIDTGSVSEPSRAVLVEGEAELITDADIARRQAASIYTRYLGEEGAKEAEPQSWLMDPDHLVIKVTPKKVITWGLEG